MTFDNLAEAERLGRAALSKRPDFIAELEHRGRERALIYKTLVMTGLRKSELASLTVGQLELDAAHPYAVLEAADEKNREGSDIQLRADVATDLRIWLADKLASLQSAARLKIGEPVPIRLPMAIRLFDVPGGLIRIMDRDLVAAGIPKRDERGRVVDIHALRTTFGTHLSKAGVSLRTAQAAMRHSKPELTANIYTDPKLLDVAGAVESLPMLSLDTKPQPERQMATGTADAAPLTYQESAPTLVPTLVPNLGKRSTPASIADKVAGWGLDLGETTEVAQVLENPAIKTPLTIAVSGVKNGRYRARTCDPQRVMLVR